MSPPPPCVLLIFIFNWFGNFYSSFSPTFIFLISIACILLLRFFILLYSSLMISLNCDILSLCSFLLVSLLKTVKIKNGQKRQTPSLFFNKIDGKATESCLSLFWVDPFQKATNSVAFVAFWLFLGFFKNEATVSVPFFNFYFLKVPQCDVVRNFSRNFIFLNPKISKN